MAFIQCPTCGKTFHCQPVGPAYVITKICAKCERIVETPKRDNTLHLPTHKKLASSGSR